MSSSNGRNDNNNASPKLFDDVSGFLHRTERRSSLGMNNAGKRLRSLDEEPDTQDAEQFKLTQDDKALLFLKSTVIFMLIVAGAIMARASHLLGTKAELEVFQRSFDQHSRALLDLFQSQVEKQKRVASMLAASITSFGLSTNATWPLISVPDFVMRTTDAMALTGSSAICLSPLVTNDTRSAWESFAGGNRIRQANRPDESEHEGDIFFPISHVAPASRKDDLFIDQFSNDLYARALSNMMNEKSPTIAAIISDSETDNSCPALSGIMLFVPIFDSFGTDRQVVGSLLFKNDWREFVSGLRQVAPLAVLVENSCGLQLTLKVAGERVDFMGQGSLHDTSFAKMEIISDYLDLYLPWHEPDASDTPTRAHITDSGIETCEASSASCQYRIRIYPTQDLFNESHKQLNAVNYFSVAMQFFFFAGVVFIGYDFMIRKRQDAIMEQAAKSYALVDSLFPAQVRNQVMESTRREGSTRRLSADSSVGFDEGSDHVDYSTIDGPPIASHFSSTTIMFADIAGFTEWSSTREPNQVFTLLETLYGAFDFKAKRLGVFKVETIGDCYVAVAGLPKPRDDHAVVMARFAYECLSSLDTLLNELEVSLGPGTARLGLRVGLHSGPVTAGVLRGDKSRFQLFGDSMNTTSRIETTGERGLIHASESTASFIIAAGKHHWLTARVDPVSAKGKGLMKTYWLRPRSRKRIRAEQESSRTMSPETGTLAFVSETKIVSPLEESEDVPKGQKPVEATLERALSTGAISTPSISQVLEIEGSWGFIGNDSIGEASKRDEPLVKSNTKLLHDLLERVLAYRIQCGTPIDVGIADCTQYKGSHVIEEVTEALPLAPFESTKAYTGKVDALLSNTVKDQLQEYVVNISFLYHNNPFHNFEHASHVAQSANKLMQQIVTANYGLVSDEGQHTYSLGLSSDPLAQFAVVFAALIHDCDHSGVPNATLVDEQADVAIKYANRSPAEQNSVELAWELLMESQYNELRKCIFPDVSEMHRFRQLVVNCVIATDIADADLRNERKKRWCDVFSVEHASLLEGEGMRRKATIVIDHIIQASDIAHTMQHWSVYIKWNEKLFLELYKSYKEGRSGVDPAGNWFNGEIGFFDFYIIPLAKKLKECGVFGMTSDEFLKYAVENRKRWEDEGHEVLDGFLKRANAQL